MSKEEFLKIQDGIEECRKLCGDHGYLCSSGLPELFAVYVPACTYEGENIVLLLQVRPNAIALVDAFNYSDHYLGSILRCCDGNVYPKLYEAAWMDPLNESVVPDGYREYIQPMLKQQLCGARL